MRKLGKKYRFPHLSLHFYFSVGEFVIDKAYEDTLRKKMQVFREATKSSKALQLVMIITYGVKQNSHSGIMQAQVRMDDLFVSPE